MALVVVGLEIRADSEESGRLVVCTVRRVTGNDEATPDTTPGVLPITVQAESQAEATGAAARCIAECADELGIAEPWELLVVIRSD